MAHIRLTEHQHFSPDFLREQFVFARQFWELLERRWEAHPHRFERWHPIIGRWFRDQPEEPLIPPVMPPVEPIPMPPVCMTCEPMPPPNGGFHPVSEPLTSYLLAAGIMGIVLLRRYAWRFPNA